MTEPKWLDVDLVEAIHARAVSQFGGSHGIRDRGLLESALDRPRNHWAYGQQPDLFSLAAAYCAGIVRNHPFVDGNKRTGDLCIRAFLFCNGYAFEPDEREEVNMITSLAAGQLDDSTLARWIADNTEPRDR